MSERERPGSRTGAPKSTETTTDQVYRPRTIRLREYANGLPNPGDWLACQLRDFADLIEVADRQGWWGREDAEQARLDQFTRRVLQECVTEVSADWWDRRAATFESARPKVDDYFGLTDESGTRKLDEHPAQRAAACRAKAQLLRAYGAESLS